MRLSRRRARSCFNTQPPEGGWPAKRSETATFASFNTQPPEGGWCRVWGRLKMLIQFQHTAARRRLDPSKPIKSAGILFQHTAARRRLGRLVLLPGQGLCFNTQPPEGGWTNQQASIKSLKSFNTQPPEGGWAFPDFIARLEAKFQHTAARRRLVQTVWLCPIRERCFNTQPPEGGWFNRVYARCLLGVSTHSRPKAAGPKVLFFGQIRNKFQHTAARRRLESGGDSKNPQA